MNAPNIYREKWQKHIQIHKGKLKNLFEKGRRQIYKFAFLSFLDISNFSIAKF